MIPIHTLDTAGTGHGMSQVAKSPTCTSAEPYIALDFSNPFLKHCEYPESLLVLLYNLVPYHTY